MSQSTIQNVHLHHKHNKAHSKVTISKVRSGLWDLKVINGHFNGKSMANSNSNQVQSPSTTVKLDCSRSPLSQSGSLSLRLDFTSPSKSPTKSHASSLGIMTSSPPSSTVSATPAMDQDKDAIKKDTNVIMKGKDAIGHDKCGIKVIGIIEKKKKIKNLGNEKAPQKIQQAAQEHMSGGKKAINGMDCD
eukprot:506882_1